MYASAIGLSALAAGRRGLDVVGHNIANAATPGYHRQRVHLVDVVYDGIHGVGVDVARVIRIEDRILRGAVLNASTDVAAAEARGDVERQLESAVASARIDERLASVFDQIERLTTRPADTTLRRGVLSAADGLATATSTLANDLTRLRGEVANNAFAAVDAVNQKAQQVADLNAEIARVEAGGDDAPDLRDRRDRLISEIAEIIDVRVIPQDGSQVTLIASNAALVVGNAALPLSLVANPAGDLELFGSGPPQALDVGGGRLAGLLVEHNDRLPDALARLDELALELMRHFDGAQATGLGRHGPFTALTGHRGVIDPTIPLASANLAIPPVAGDLFISVTNQATGVRTLHTIAIDPATMSLNDVAAAITAGTGGLVAATVNPPDNTLELQAAAGFAFDFAGQLPTVPDNVAMNGTSVPTVTGIYDGDVNDTWSFEVIGAGTVGVTPGLSLEVRDGAGALIATLDVGAGYVPGSDLLVRDGIRVALSAGTTANGTFESRVVADPDTADILPALGVNSLFRGINAATLEVRPDLAADPQLLSAGRSNEPGDGRNLERFAAARDLPLLDAGTRTFQQFVLDLVGDVGNEVRALELEADAAATLRDGLVRQEQGLVGVDINEELVRLLEFQRLIEAATRFLGVANESVDEIMRLVG